MIASSGSGRFYSVAGRFFYSKRGAGITPPPPPAPALLLEDGTDILLEDTTPILLEG